MERQRSFSFKPTSLPFFSFTILCSLLFCFLFTRCVLKNSPSSSQEAHLLFSSGIKTTEEAQSFSDSGSNFFAGEADDIIFGGTHLKKIANSSGEAWDSSQETKDTTLSDTHFNSPQERKNTTLSDTDFNGTADPAGEALDSVWKSKEASSADTHFRGTANVTEEGVNPVAERKNSNVTDISFRESDGLSVEGVASGIVRVQGKTSESVAFNVSKDSFEVKSMIGVGFGSSYNASGNSTASVGRAVERESGGACDVSSGRWVFDEIYPLYTNAICPFIDEGFSCQTNGRPDTDYMKWRWQPNNCNIPRFSAVKMLELIRGKRLVFVGDSINRNQWESMLCLLRGGISDPKRVYEARRRRITKGRGNYNFKFADYHCSLEYYVTHFLVHESKAKVGHKRVPTLQIDTIDRSSSKWRGADILVFNTAHWWSHYKTKSGVNYYQEGELVHPHLDVSTAFRRALMTWASWVDQHVIPGKTQVFFRSSSPSHFWGGEWNSGGHCEVSTQPHNETLIRSYPENNIIVEQVLKQMKTPVTLLNVTSLSGLRIDGHPSIYGRNPGRGPSKGIQDCSHWCLPGVPDAWNELLYFYLHSKQTQT